VAAVAIGVAGCRRVPTPSMDRATCGDEIRDAFFRQDFGVLVLAPADEGSLWRGDVLQAVDAVCAGLEDVQTGWDISPRCITAVSLMETHKGGPPRMVILRDEFPLRGPDDERRVAGLATSLEFAIGDTVDREGTRTFVHLPLVSFEGVDLASTVKGLLEAQPSLRGALDLPAVPTSEAFVTLAQGGPSARGIVGLYDAGVDGGLKEPEHLAAIQRFQERAEGLRAVTQSFTIVDDLKVTRQGLRGGRPEAFSLPTSRAETAQLLLALSMSPATRLGARIDGRERVGLLRVNMSAVADDQARRTVRKLASILAQETPDGARSLLCTDLDADGGPLDGEEEGPDAEADPP
jgi:hypothetical protein